MEILSNINQPSLLESRNTLKKGRFASKITQLNGIFKVLTGVLIIVNMLSYVVTTALLEENNKYLAFLGITENTGANFKIIKKENTELKDKITSLSAKSQEIQRRIDEKDFYIENDLINKIQAEKRPWISTKLGEPQLGLLDIAPKLEQYFNEGDFEHSILFRTGNQLNIRNVSFREEVATFTIDTSNFFGNIFLLSAEISGIINGLPHFKDGEILNYQRQKKSDGNDSMSFTLNVKLQKSTEKDPDDSNPSSIQFLNWATK